MHQKLSSKNKIHLLLISLEALNIYIDDYTLKYKSKKYNIFIDHSCNFFYKYSLLHFHSTIHDLYLIYNLIYTSKIHDLAYRILHSFSIENKKNSFSYINTKYLNKFLYIYYQYKSYYQNHYINLKTIAIMNLYIIIHIKKINGFHYLIKYLK